MIRVGENVATTIVDKDDVEFAIRTRFAEMRSVDGCCLTGTVASKQTLEYSHSIIVRNNLLKTNAGDMQLWYRSAHVGIALVGTNTNFACGSNTKVGSCHSTFGSHKIVAQMRSEERRVGEERRSRRSPYD